MRSTDKTAAHRQRRETAVTKTETKPRERKTDASPSLFQRTRRLRLLIAVLSAAIGAALFSVFVFLPSVKYASAKKLLAADEPDKAMSELGQIYNFRDSAALYGKAATAIGDAFLDIGYDINAAVWFTWAGRSIEAEQIFDFHSVVSGSSYVTAAIAQNGKTYYLSNRDGDDKHAGAVTVSSFSAFLPHAPGVNGFDKFGFVKLHALGQYGVDLPSEQRETLCTTAGIKDMISIPKSDDSPGYTVLLYQDGTIGILSEAKYPLSNTYSWKNIVSIKEGYRKIFGIDRAGRLHIAYESGYPDELRYDISDWDGVQKVVETGKAIVGLTREGSITVAYAGTEARYRNSLTYQQQITDIATNSNLLLLLRANGSVNAIRVPNWAADGDSGADKYLDRAAAAVRGWRGVTRIRFASKGLYGIRFDGTALYVSCDVSYNSEKRRYEYNTHPDFAAAVRRWTDTVDVINCGTHAVGVFADGTLEAIGDGTYLEARPNASGATDYLRKPNGEYMNVNDWKLW